MLGRVFCSNSLMVAIGSGDLACEGLSAAAFQLLAPGLCGLLLLGVGLVPWLTMVPQLRQVRPLPWALAFYLLVMLVWSWLPYRFLVPILPFLTVYLLMGPAELLKRVPSGAGGRVAAAVGLGVVLLANLGLLARHAQTTSLSGYALMKVTDTPVAWASYARTLAWVRQNSEPDDVVASGLDSMVALYTDRQAFRPFVYNPGRLFYGQGAPHLMTVEELVAILKRSRPRYLMHTPMPGFAEEKLLAEVLDELRRRHPGWLGVAYEDADQRFVVFELNTHMEPGDGQPTPSGERP
jgi:hypothetical protein